ncbi:methyltransferase [Leifsonia sp. 22587]|uniref:methyltransferase n=1 Tax=Leifsonia sp. 22587 TaxID=3453946 RepID=UPI003F859FDA
MTTELVRVATLLRSFALNQIIASAARVDLFGKVQGGCSSFEGLAEETGLPERSVRMLAAVLGELDLLAVEGESVNPTASTSLLGKDEGRLYGQALLCADEYYKAWASLDQTLRTGRSAFEAIYGKDFWSYLDQDAEALENFSRTMSAGASQAADRIIDAYPFDDHTIVVDIGAGDGTFVERLLERASRLSVVALDLPQQAALAEKRLASWCVAGRAHVHAADIFADAAPLGDLYLLKGVLHNWRDEEAIRLLERVRTAAPQARVLVAERVVEGDTALTMRTAMNSLTMSLLHGASERSDAQYLTLLKHAGYRARRYGVTEDGIALFIGDNSDAESSMVLEV